jgi:TIR domain
MKDPHSKTIHIFYMFAAEDEKYVKKLQQHLTGHQRLYQFTDWYHTQVLAGEDREQRINENLDKANIILLFTSAAFLHSEINIAQVQRAMERYYKRDGVIVIPIKLHPVDLIGQPFGKLETLPKGEKTILQWDNKDEAFLQVAEEIGKVIKAKIGEREYTLNPLTKEQAPPEIHHMLETTEIRRPVQ